MTTPNANVDIELFDVVADVEVGVNIMLYNTSEVEVYYGVARVLAVLNTDYTIELETEDYFTFIFKATNALITKINALIAAAPTVEENVVYIRRRTSVIATFDAASSFYRNTLVTQVDRLWMHAAEVDDRLATVESVQGTLVDAEAAMEAAAVSAAAALASQISAAASAAAAEAAVDVVSSSFTAVRSSPYLTLQQINYAGAASGPTNSWLYARILAFGASNPDADGKRAVNRIQVNDTVNADDGSLDAFTVIHRVGGGTAAGVRHAIHADFGATGLIGGGPGGYLAMVALQASAFCSANQGGTGGAFTIPDDTWKGGLFAGNDHARLSSTFMRTLIGREMNIEIETGGSSYAKIGQIVVKGPNDTTQAFADDAAYAIQDKGPTGIPWKTGISFGLTWGMWPFDNNSVLIRHVRSLYPTDDGAYSDVALGGIDFDDIQFASYAYRSKGWRVLPEGAIEMDEQTAPAAPAANKVRLYAVDNGAGKTQLMALFSSGAAQQVAIQP